MNSNYLESTRKQFRYYKSLADKTFVVLNDDDIHWRKVEVQNNIVTLVKHMAGNMLSRFTNFLSEDGEKDWRNRDDEFEDTLATKDEMITYWDKGWNCLFNSMDHLSPKDLERIIYIRNEGHTVLEALNRQMAHYAYHVGQIVFIGKLLKGDQWNSLTIPKGASKDFNKEKFNQNKERRHFTDDAI
ncbi:DUF1572 family protein [Zhouia amylolytica]|uniref:DUF1572 domain-containing protein n=1 Tax=Zhouia amylolytica AD3 TaxID=1286632 RepID=W2UST8_9FLAO|nr:DUF1572 family protein [Zhouia amylolytica]ETN96546.1 hypothetical protein P278_06240 [Zhouia amylolytica AD3]